jgi:hypothetical protein
MHADSGIRFGSPQAPRIIRRPQLKIMTAVGSAVESSHDFVRRRMCNQCLHLRMGASRGLPSSYLPGDQRTSHKFRKLCPKPQLSGLPPAQEMDAPLSKESLHSLYKLQAFLMTLTSSLAVLRCSSGFTEDDWTRGYMRTLLDQLHFELLPSEFRVIARKWSK